MRNASDALDWLHERGVVHGDVKPSNFLISGKYCALSDFGFLLPPSELHKAGDKSDSAHQAYVTHEYTAPEIWSHADEANILSHLTSFSDQFALAATYVELRTGVHPYRRGPVKTTIAILQNKPDLKRLTGPERDVVLKALSNEPADRYRSCGEFVAELVKCHQEVTMPPRPQAPLVPITSEFDLNTECIIDENDLNRPYRRRPSLNKSKREAWLLPALLGGLIVAILIAVAALRYELFATNPVISAAKSDNSRRSEQPPPGPIPQNPTISSGKSPPLDTNKGKVNQESKTGSIPDSLKKETGKPPKPTQKGVSNPSTNPKNEPVTTPSIPETLQFRRVVNWQGRDWSSKAGPQTNPDLVFTDNPRSIGLQGNTLSLTISKSGADWHCTELISNDVEYGRYVV
jgi:serine/threonine protein kinase